MPTTNKPILRAWLPAMAWLAVIACESTSLASAARTSSILYPILLFFSPHLTSAHLELAHDVVRKIGHCFGYAMLSLVALRAWSATLMLRAGARRLPSWRAMVDRWSGRAAALAWLSAVTVAGVDEWHQTFIPGRTGVVRDVVLDSMAAAFLQLAVITFSNVRPKSALGRWPVAIGHERQSPMANS